MMLNMKQRGLFIFIAMLARYIEDISCRMKQQWPTTWDDSIKTAPSSTTGHSIYCSSTGSGFLVRDLQAQTGKISIDDIQC